MTATDMLTLKEDSVLSKHGDLYPGDFWGVTLQLVDRKDQKFTEVRPGIFGAILHTPQLTATLYRYDPGSCWEEHKHSQDQITTVLEGNIDFVIEGQAVRLSAGQLAALPGETRHSAAAPASGATTLNVFTHREDQPDG